MAREPEGYRLLLERLNEFFPDKNILTKSDVRRYTGLDRSTIAKRYAIGKNGIEKTQLALRMCKQ